MQRGTTIGPSLLAGIGGTALGAIAFGALADSVGMRATMSCLGAAGLLIASAAWAWARRSGARRRGGTDRR